MLNCCSGCTGMYASDLESLEQIDNLFTASLHKIIFHIFHNISKRYIHGLRLFQYKNMCDLCDIMQDKENRGEIMAKKSYVIHEEVIDVFHKKSLYFHNRMNLILS